MSKTHAFVTVDMRELRAALVARARDDRVSVSAIVRGAVARELGLAEHQAGPLGPAAPDAERVRLSIRLTRAQAARLSDASRQVGLPRGAYLSKVIDGVPIPSEGAPWATHLAALVASNARLSTLSRNVVHLVALLREGAVQSALAYADTLDVLGSDVRAHLALAARTLQGLRPTAAMYGDRRDSHR